MRIHQETPPEEPGEPEPEPAPDEPDTEDE
jgi:hypothetical protein